MVKRFSKKYGNKGRVFNYLQSESYVKMPVSGLTRARLSCRKERVWSNCILRFVLSCPRNLWHVNWFIYRSDACGFPPSELESLVRARLLNISQTFNVTNVTNLMRNNESQYVTVVDKPIKMPRISWTA